MFITSVVTTVCHHNSEPTLYGGSAKQGCLCFDETWIKCNWGATTVTAVLGTGVSTQ